MTPSPWISYTLYLLLLGAVCLGVAPKRAKPKPRTVRSNEYKIKKIILKGYDMTTRPVYNDSTAIDVNLAISLYHILDTNEKQQTFTSLLAVRQRWKDEYLQWNASEFGGVDSIRVPANRIWTPDLVVSNFAGDKFNDFMVTNAIISSNGNVLWLYPALIKTYCTLNVKYFPFDSQACKIIFISWTFSGYQLDVIYNSTFQNMVYYNPENQEWAVDRIEAVRNEKYYACCAEPYPDVTFTIIMRRGSLFYIVNLIAPCFLIFLISFLGFFLPVESGEKVNLETTILLALVVFLLMVGETMPPTPDAIPILGLFFGSTMVMVTLALVMAVIVTNLYAKKDSCVRPPRVIVRVAKRFYRNEMLPTDRLHPSQRAKRDCNGRHSDVISITDGEIDTLNGPCTCCCKCHDGSGCGGAGGAGYPNDYSRSNGGCCGGGGRYGGAGDGSVCGSFTGGRGSNASAAMYSHVSFEICDAEWRLVSKFADRVFFWIFVFISTTAQTMLFVQMVPSDDFHMNATEVSSTTPTP